MGKYEKYLNECIIINDMSPADFNHIEDGQTRWIIEKIKTLKTNKKRISILDYGCGKMRLFNALSQEEIEFEYVGIDFSSDQNIDRLVKENKNCKFVKVEDINKLERYSFDIVCLTNVIHEISILEFSKILMNIKLLIKQDGHFLLVDMSVLPHGELLGLPYYPYEIQELFSPVDYAFKTPNGYPIIACDILESDIMMPHKIMKKLYYIIGRKRDKLSYLAFDVLNKGGIKKFNEEYEQYNSRMSSDDLFGYINYLSGLANYRLKEFLNKYEDNGKNEFYVDLVKLYIDTYDEYSKQLTITEVYKSLYPKYTVLEITKKLNIALMQPSFFMLEKDKETLFATDRLDYFLDNYTYEDLKKHGISVMSAFCEIT